MHNIVDLDITAYRFTQADWIWNGTLLSKIGYCLIMWSKYGCTNAKNDGVHCFSKQPPLYHSKQFVKDICMDVCMYECMHIQS